MIDNAMQKLTMLDDYFGYLKVVYKIAPQLPGDIIQSQW